MDRLIFNLLSVIYALQTARVIYTLARRWTAFWDPVFTPADWRLAQELCVFVFIPVGVFFHEGGHWLAARQAGLMNLEFHYRLFWGYVAYTGAVSPTLNWWIALAGNVVSVLFGFILALWGYYGRTLPIPARYTLLYAGQVQTIYALIGYPLLSFAGFQGDWVTIYAFDRTPVLSTAALIAHLALLFGSVLWWRSRVSPTTS